MGKHSERLFKIRNAAKLLTALSFLLVLVSSYIRLNGAGLGCAGWPDCYGQLLAGEPHPHIGVVRIMHRVAATLSLLVAFFAAWHCLRPVPIQPVARYATSLLVLMIALTFVGIWSADAHRAWASFINMLGGLLLVSLSWRMVLATDAAPAKPGSARSRSFALSAGFAALLMTVALGALIGARYAAISCTSVPGCDGIWWPQAGSWEALNPFVTILAPGHAGEEGGVALHLLHRYFGAAAILLLGAAGWRALRAAATRGAASWLLAVLIVEFALGSLTVLTGFNLWLAISHSVGAALLMTAGIKLLRAYEA